MCLCTLIAFVAAFELREAMALRRFVRSVPIWDEEKHREIITKHHTCLAIKRFTSVGGAETIAMLATGITDGYRCFAICGLILPKLAIAIATLVYASGYLLHAETNEDTILSTVAAVFVLEVSLSHKRKFKSQI